MVSLKFYWVFLGFPGIHRIFLVFFRVLLGFNGFTWDLLNGTCFFRVLLGFTGFLAPGLGLTGLY